MNIDIKQEVTIGDIILEVGDRIKIIEASQFKVLGLSPNQKNHYSGDPLESGGTSIKGSVVKAITTMYANKEFEGAKTIIDYGAGKYGRNADWLREQGFSVYAYDPFNGTSSDGWDIGNVSNTLPSGIQFDIGFTAYVLNVVPKHIEEIIIADIKKIAKTTFHITRNRDVYDMVKKALLRQDKYVYNFYINEYEGDSSEVENPDIIMDYCLFGVQTVKGFQRIPECEDSGYNLIKNTSGFKIYKD